MILCPIGTSVSIGRCNASPCERPLNEAASTTGDSGGTFPILAKICVMQ